MLGQTNTPLILWLFTQQLDQDIWGITAGGSLLLPRAGGSVKQPRIKVEWGRIGLMREGFFFLSSMYVRKPSDPVALYGVNEKCSWQNHKVPLKSEQNFFRTDGTLLSLFKREALDKFTLQPWLCWICFDIFIVSILSVILYAFCGKSAKVNNLKNNMSIKVKQLDHGSRSPKSSAYSGRGSSHARIFSTWFEMHVSRRPSRATEGTAEITQ